MDGFRVADRAGKSTRETSPSAALSRVAHTGSMAPPAPPGIRTGLTRVFPGACGATRSATHCHRRGYAWKRMMPDVGGTPAPIAFRPNACRSSCCSKEALREILGSLCCLLLNSRTLRSRHLVEYASRTGAGKARVPPARPRRCRVTSASEKERDTHVCPDRDHAQGNRLVGFPGTGVAHDLHGVLAHAGIPAAAPSAPARVVTPG